MGWSEDEIRATIKAYFHLLEKQSLGHAVNKSQIYRELAKSHSRSAKAFELKFQNVSAILYELKLQYADGLKPRSNYQRLLKLMVLDHLDRTPLPASEPHEILFGKLSNIAKRGPLAIKRKGSGRFGLAIEEALAIPQNSSRAADFMGIELKTKSDKSLQTLFSRVPDRYPEDSNKTGMFARHSYHDQKRDRKALYTSFSFFADSLGFQLRVDTHNLQIVRSNKVVMEYDAETIESALLSKHSQSFFIKVNPLKKDGIEYCEIDYVLYCKWPSIIRFLELIEEGSVFLDLTMSQKGAGAVKDHGFLWRIKPEALSQLYLEVESLDFHT